MSGSRFTRSVKKKKTVSASAGTLEEQVEILNDTVALVVNSLLKFQDAINDDAEAGEEIEVLIPGEYLGEEVE